MLQLSALVLATTIAGSGAAGSGQVNTYANQICSQLGARDCAIIKQLQVSNKEELKNQLKNMGIRIDLSDCPDFEFPEWNQPGQGTPDTSLPEVTPPENDAPEQTPEDDSYASQVVKLVNEERAKAGLAALTLDKEVAAAAQVRAKEIEKSFSHTRPNGSTFSTALTEQGVSFRGSGENIAWGQRTPEEVVRGWMNSEGHRANILNKNFKNIGVGYYQGTGGTNYWTQLFTY